jgi:hypothetical protein
MQMKATTEPRHMSKKKAATKTVTPAKALPAGLHKKQGVWVFSTGRPITAAQMEKTPSIDISRTRNRDGRRDLAKPRARLKAQYLLSWT